MKPTEGPRQCPEPEVGHELKIDLYIIFIYNQIKSRSNICFSTLFLPGVKQPVVMRVFVSSTYETSSGLNVIY